MSKLNQHNKSHLRDDLLGLGLATVAINSIATQFVANRLHYHPSLGLPWFDKFYAPWSWFLWQASYYQTAKVTFSLVQMFLIIAIGSGLLAYLSLLNARANTSIPFDDVHGTAHFADETELKRTGLLSKERETAAGVYVGGWTDEAGNLHYLRHNGPEHVAAIAPTRSGKGVGLVVPTLLSWPHSVVINDMKGELWALTSGYRKTKAKNKVLRFDPASASDSCAFNPLEEIRVGTAYEVGDVQNLVTIIVDPDGKGLADHWAKTSHALLTGLILHLLYKTWECEQLASLYDVALSLSDPQRPIQELYDEMLENKHPRLEVHQVVAAAARDMLNRPETERGSVLSSAMSYLSIYRDPLVRKNTAKSDFRISDLMKAEDPVSLYLVVRPADKDRLKPLMRLMLNQIVRVLTRDEMKFTDGKADASYTHRLLLMLDEFPSFGKLEVFQEALAFIAGYGMKAYLIMQDISQLQAAYGEHESILSNCHVQIAYAPNKSETSKWLSDKLGQKTVVMEEISTSGTRLGQSKKNVSRSYRSVGRPLMTPDECSRLQGPLKDEATGDILEPGKMLIFAAGHAPILGTQLLYFQDPWFREQAKIPSPQETDRFAARPRIPFHKPAISGGTHIAGAETSVSNPKVIPSLVLNSNEKAPSL